MPVLALPAWINGLAARERDPEALAKSHDAPLFARHEEEAADAFRRFRVVRGDAAHLGFFVERGAERVVDGHR